MFAFVNLAEFHGLPNHPFQHSCRIIISLKPLSDMVTVQSLEICDSKLFYYFSVCII